MTLQDVYFIAEIVGAIAVIGSLLFVGKQLGQNSHHPFRRERAMAKFRNLATLQKFVSVHASIHNHFNKDRHLESP